MATPSVLALESVGRKRRCQPEGSGHVGERGSRGTVRELGERYGVRRIRVFGSTARGEARQDSDIDLLVEYQPGHGGLRLRRVLRADRASPRPESGRGDGAEPAPDDSGESARPGRVAVSAPERDEGLYLADIRGAVERILRYTSGGRDEFFADPMRQDAVIRNLEVMGEAVRKVSDETREAHPDLPWRQMAATRDRVIHGYFTVDLEIVWEIVEDELPRLRDVLSRARARDPCRRPGIAPDPRAHSFRTELSHTHSLGPDAVAPKSLYTSDMLTPSQRTESEGARDRSHALALSHRGAAWRRGHGGGLPCPRREAGAGRCRQGSPGRIPG